MSLYWRICNCICHCIDEFKTYFDPPAEFINRSEKFWCVLVDKYMQFYEHPWGTESKRMRSINCDHITCVEPENYTWTEIEIYALRVYFELKLTSDLFAFRTDCPKEKARWFITLKQFEDIEAINDVSSSKKEEE